MLDVTVLQVRNHLGACFIIKFTSLFPSIAWPRRSKQHHFISGSTTCWIVPVARCLFHIDPEAEGRVRLCGINTVAKGTTIQHSPCYIHRKLRNNPRKVHLV